MVDENIAMERNFDEVKIVDDETEELSIIREIIRKTNEEDTFYTLDVGELIKQQETMVSKVPRVKPYYAVKCNPNSTVVKTMAALNNGFDCASKHEIEQVMAIGVPGERIIFSNTMKPNSHIRFAREVGVSMMTVDGEPELRKIKSIFPEAKVIIRFRCDAESSMVSFGQKAGCNADTDAPKLMKIAKDLGLNVHGFNFNVGTQCLEATPFARGIKIAVGLIEHARSLGFDDAKLIDIGGGFPSRDRCQFDKFADVINEVLKDVDTSIEVISEPGRYYVGTAFTLTSCISGKKIVQEEARTRYFYYVTDGIFGSFCNSVLNHYVPLPIPVNTPSKEEPHPTTIFGPTTSVRDCVVRECFLPELNIGDWILWPYMGAYTIARWRVKNRNDGPAVFPFVRRKVWEDNRFLSQPL